MRTRGVFWLLTLALGAVGCPGGGGSGGPSPKCEKRGEQCQYAAGTIGVCNDTPCEEGKLGPCLKCVSQH